MNIIEVGDTFNCDCGFSWMRGLSGSHNCGIGLRRQVADLKAQILANREAQPAAWVCGDEEINDFKNGREVFIVRDHEDPDLEYLPLFTAPPASAVTSELLEAMGEVIRISDRDHDAWNRAKEAIAACRAAMLAAPTEGEK